MECVDRSGLRHRRAAPFFAPPHGMLYPLRRVWDCQGAMVLWGELFEYCSDDAAVFCRYKRHCFFQNSDLFGAQRMLLRRIPISHFVAVAITLADRFYWVREHELVQSLCIVRTLM